jgi:hypothetical protein
MSDIIAKRFEITGDDKLALKRWATILDDLEDAIEQYADGFVDCDYYVREEFSKMQVAGISFFWAESKGSIVVELIDEIPYDVEDKFGYTDRVYKKAWGCKGKTANAVAKKLSGFLKKYADFIEDGTIQTEYGITAKEADALSEYVKSHLVASK